MATISIIRQTAKEIIELGSKSAILADPKSNLFCKQYENIRKVPFAPSFHLGQTYLKDLAKDHGLKYDRILNNIQVLANSNKNKPGLEKNLNQNTYDKLSNNLKPDYYNLFHSLGRVKDGVQTLVKIREDILSLLEPKKKTIINSDEEKDLKIMNSILKNLLVLWFSTGLLNIQRIDWHSPAVLVEKVAHYESVHQIRTLNDLKNRLSSSRRCFIYTHSTMPYEPLVILHIALTNEISSNIQDLIKYSVKESSNNTQFNKNEATNAIFYSINSCQKGLQNVDLGNALIKSCVRLLLNELPSLKYFHTLSPIPKFKEWLDLKISIAISNSNQESSNIRNEFFDIDKCFTNDELNTLKEIFNISANDKKSTLYEKLKQYLNSSKFQYDQFQANVNKTKQEIELNEILANFLNRSCAFYLYYEKKNGYAFNSVANFHLRNGAQIYRINYGADISDKGWKNSYTMMVNYGYYLNELENNCVKYLGDKVIRKSELVNTYLENFNCRSAA